MPKKEETQTDSVMPYVMEQLVVAASKHTREVALQAAAIVVAHDTTVLNVNSDVEVSDMTIRMASRFEKWILDGKVDSHA